MSIPNSKYKITITILMVGTLVTLIIPLSSPAKSRAPPSSQQRESTVASLCSSDFLINCKENCIKTINHIFFNDIQRRQFIAVTTYFQNTFGVLHITITQRYTFLSVEHNHNYNNYNGLHSSISIDAECRLHLVESELFVHLI